MLVMLFVWELGCELRGLQILGYVAVCEDAGDVFHHGDVYWVIFGKVNMGT